MAILSLNNKENAKDLICFSNCPNIITIEQTGVTPVNESVTLDVSTMLAIDESKPSKMIVNGNAITSTNDISKLNGRRFYMGKNEFAALSIVNALNSIPSLAMNYSINFNQNKTFTITAKNPGSQYLLTFEYENMDGVREVKRTNGSITGDNLVGSYFSRVYLDLYYNDKSNQKLINSTSTEANYKYLTTLQKEYYKDGVSFNVSPALQSVSNHNNTTIWTGKLYAMVDGSYIDLADTKDNYIINGYLVNQGGTYLEISKTIPALNVNRGENRTQYNNTILYIYDNIFPISLYKVNGKTSESVKISYLESDEVEITASTQTITFETDKNISTYDIVLDELFMRESYYIDLTFSFGVIRLNVINPPYANAECNRVYWFNSYGGVSYFDFLGDKKDERKSDVTTYNKSLLDFYKNDKQEQAVVYFRDNEMTVSLTSHLMDKDGLWLLYDLQNSYKSWITINGVPYYIIIQSVTVEEPSDNVYTATVKYKYSLLDSFT